MQLLTSPPVPSRSPLRILQVIPTYYPAVRYGGPIYAVRGLVRALVAAGHQVTVLTTNADGDGQLDVPVARPVTLDGATIYYFSARHVRRLNVSIGLMGGLVQQLGSVDIVHLHSMFSFPTTVGGFLAHRYRVPYVVSPRGSLVPELIARQSPRVKRAWLRVFDERTLRNAARLQVTAESEYRDAARIGVWLPPAAVVPNGVDSPVHVPAAPASRDLAVRVDGSPYVLYLGRLSWKKGLERVLRSLVGTTLRLCVAGNDEEGIQPSLEALARELGVERNVLFLGHVEGSDKWWLLKHAHSFVLASYNENFGNAVVEAMAMGCPVVVTHEVGVAGHVAAANAGFVVDGDSGELKDTLLRLASDVALRDQLGANGRAYAREHLTWEGAARQMEAVYREVLRPSS